MTQVRAAKAANSTRSYARVLGVPELGALVSKIHSASIRNGNELERMIAERVECIPELDEFLTAEIMPEGVLLATKKAIKASATIDFGRAEPDFQYVMQQFVAHAPRDVLVEQILADQSLRDLLRERL